MIKFSKLFPWKRRPKIIKTKIVDPKIGLSEEMRKELAEEMRIRHVYTVLKDRFERTVHTIVESFTPGSFDDAYLGHESPTFKDSEGNRISQ